LEVILDTNALSDWWKNLPQLQILLNSATQIYVPVPALAEFRFGVLQSSKEREMENWLSRVIPSTVILHVDDVTSFHYADLRLALKRAGTPIPMNDLWIAALARQHRLPIASRDAHFDVVPDLRRLTW